MSDSVEETKSNLKAGHPPAVKLSGGVRITQHRIPTAEKPVPKTDAKDDEEENEPISESPPKPMITTVSGAPVRGYEDFPTSSIKAFHEKKPMPTNECRPMVKNHMHIHQPKK